MSTPEETISLAVREALKETGALVAAARREKKMTQDQLANRIGVKRDTVARLERGAPGVSVGWVLTAAWVLGLPILRSSDFASARPTTAVATFLEQLDAQLPTRVRPTREEPDDDF